MIITTTTTTITTNSSTVSIRNKSSTSNHKHRMEKEAEEEEEEDEATAPRPREKIETKKMMRRRRQPNDAFAAASSSSTLGDRKLSLITTEAEQVAPTTTMASQPTRLTSSSPFGAKSSKQRASAQASAQAAAAAAVIMERSYALESIATTKGVLYCKHKCLNQVQATPAQLKPPPTITTPTASLTTEAKADATTTGCNMKNALLQPERSTEASMQKLSLFVLKTTRQDNNNIKSDQKNGAAAVADYKRQIRLRASGQVKEQKLTVSHSSSSLNHNYLARHCRRLQSFSSSSSSIKPLAAAVAPVVSSLDVDNFDKLQHNQEQQREQKQQQEKVPHYKTSNEMSNKKQETTTTRANELRFRLSCARLVTSQAVGGCDRAKLSGANGIIALNENYHELNANDDDQLSNNEDKNENEQNKTTNKNEKNITTIATTTTTTTTTTTRCQINNKTKSNENRNNNNNNNKKKLMIKNLSQLMRRQQNQQVLSRCLAGFFSCRPLFVLSLGLFFAIITLTSLFGSLISLSSSSSTESFGCSLFKPCLALEVKSSSSYQDLATKVNQSSSNANQRIEITTQPTSATLSAPSQLSRSTQATPTLAAAAAAAAAIETTTTRPQSSFASSSRNSTQPKKTITATSKTTDILPVARATTTTTSEPHRSQQLDKKNNIDQDDDNNSGLIPTVGSLILNDNNDDNDHLRSGTTRTTRRPKQLFSANRSRVGADLNSYNNNQSNGYEEIIIGRRAPSAFGLDSGGGGGGGDLLSTATSEKLTKQVKSTDFAPSKSGVSVSGLSIMPMLLDNSTSFSSTAALKLLPSPTLASVSTFARQQTPAAGGNANNNNNNNNNNPHKTDWNDSATMAINPQLMRQHQQQASSITPTPTPTPTTTTNRFYEEEDKLALSKAIHEALENIVASTSSDNMVGSSPATVALSLPARAQQHSSLSSMKPAMMPMVQYSGFASSLNNQDVISHLLNSLDNRPTLEPTQLIRRPNSNNQQQQQVVVSASQSAPSVSLPPISHLLTPRNPFKLFASASAAAPITTRYWPVMSKQHQQQQRQPLVMDSTTTASVSSQRPRSSFSVARWLGGGGSTTTNNNNNNNYNNQNNNNHRQQQQLQSFQLNSMEAAAANLATMLAASSSSSSSNQNNNDNLLSEPGTPRLYAHSHSAEQLEQLVRAASQAGHLPRNSAPILPALVSGPSGQTFPGFYIPAIDDSSGPMASSASSSDQSFDSSRLSEQFLRGGGGATGSQLSADYLASSSMTSPLNGQAAAATSAQPNNNNNDLLSKIPGTDYVLHPDEIRAMMNIGELAWQRQAMRNNDNMRNQDGRQPVGSEQKFNYEPASMAAPPVNDETNNNNNNWQYSRQTANLMQENHAENARNYAYIDNPKYSPFGYTGNNQNNQNNLNPNNQENLRVAHSMNQIQSMSAPNWPAAAAAAPPPPPPLHPAERLPHAMNASTLRDSLAKHLARSRLANSNRAAANSQAPSAELPALIRVNNEDYVHWPLINFGSSQLAQAVTASSIPSRQLSGSPEDDKFISNNQQQQQQQQHHASDHLQASGSSSTDSSSGNANNRQQQQQPSPPPPPPPRSTQTANTSSAAVRLATQLTPHEIRQVEDSILETLIMAQTLQHQRKIMEALAASSSSSSPRAQMMNQQQQQQQQQQVAPLMASNSNTNHNLRHLGNRWRLRGANYNSMAATATTPTSNGHSNRLLTFTRRRRKRRNSANKAAVNNPIAASSKHHHAASSVSISMLMDPSFVQAQSSSSSSSSRPLPMDPLIPMDLASFSEFTTGGAIGSAQSPMKPLILERQQQQQQQLESKVSTRLPVVLADQESNKLQPADAAAASSSSSSLDSTGSIGARFVADASSPRVSLVKLDGSKDVDVADDDDIRGKSQQQQQQVKFGSRVSSAAQSISGMSGGGGGGVDQIKSAPLQLRQAKQMNLFVASGAITDAAAAATTTAPLINNSPRQQQQQQQLSFGQVNSRAINSPGTAHHQLIASSENLRALQAAAKAHQARTLTTAGRDSSLINVDSNDNNNNNNLPNHSSRHQSQTSPPQPSTLEANNKHLHQQHQQQVANQIVTFVPIANNRDRQISLYKSGALMASSSGAASAAGNAELISSMSLAPTSQQQQQQQHQQVAADSRTRISVDWPTMTSDADYFPKLSSLLVENNSQVGSGQIGDEFQTNSPNRRPPLIGGQQTLSSSLSPKQTNLINNNNGNNYNNDDYNYNNNNNAPLEQLVSTQAKLQFAQDYQAREGVPIYNNNVRVAGAGTTNKLFLATRQHSSTDLNNSPTGAGSGLNNSDDYETEDEDHLQKVASEPTATSNQRTTKVSQVVKSTTSDTKKTKR